MVNPDEIEVVSKKPTVTGSEFARKNVHQTAYYIRAEHGASYDVIIGKLATYRNKETGEYVHIFTQDSKNTTFKDEVHKYYQEDGYKNSDIGDPIPPLDQALENGGKVYLPTEFDAFGVVPN